MTEKQTIPITDDKIDPQDYFNYIKSKKETCTDEFLTKAYDITMHQLRKAMVTGQDLMVRRLAYTLSVIEREHSLLDLGLDVFVLREDIEYFIENVTNKRVKIVDLEFYPREIPDSVVEKVMKLKELKIFDNYYVVFTDYTGNVTKETKKAVKEEVKRKDPILFGTFEQKIDGVFDICDRFYYIGDWEDEYCDLTLSKMVQEMSKAGKGNIVNDLAIPEVTEDSIREYINRLDEDADNMQFHLGRRKKKSFIDKVKLVWKDLISD